jgi:hypothetical protein
MLRNRAQFLGVVQALGERAAEKAAIEAFALDEDRRRRCERTNGLERQP